MPPGRPHLARPATGRRLRIQSEVAQDLLDHWPLQDGRDDLQFPAAAVGAVLHVDVKDTLEQPRPTDALRPDLGGLDLAPGGRIGFGGRLLSIRWPPVLITVAAVWVMGERAPRGTAWAPALSLVGVGLIVRTGGGIFGWGASLALLAAFRSVAFALLTRSLARTEDTIATLFIGGVVASLLLALFLPFVW